jgi:hypothetical protein
MKYVENEKENNNKKIYENGNVLKFKSEFISVSFF